ncbi:MAG: serine/threonine-protein kinase [Myxococcota bacterium]
MSTPDDIELGTSADAPTFGHRPQPGACDALTLTPRLAEDGDGVRSIAIEEVEARARMRLFGHTPEPAPRIGRFTVLEQIGHGGMGLVYAAYDEHLDRKIAVKVLRAERASDDEEQERLWREAQAMARLSHPNIATVHEVGLNDGEVFVALEFLDGQCLSTWLKTRPAWPQIVDAFEQAGRGLLAAHDSGLVHRDFKPHNAVRLDDGVVKVLDFGLARSTYERVNRSSSTLSGPLSTTNSLTLPGTVVGTPAYMPPEQHFGKDVDARGDQYAFCAAVWEGLTGTHPFRQPTFDELLDAKLLGAPTWPDDAPRVPRRIVDALRRGLAPEPDRRWPSMAPLLEALARGPQRRRKRWQVGLASVFAMGVAGMGATSWVWAQAQRCSGAAEHLAGVWDETRRAEVEAAILSVDRAYATDVDLRTQRELDAYAQLWQQSHTEACEATTLRGEQSSQMLDLRMQCLQRSAMDLRAVVDTLALADHDVVRKAHELVLGLPALSRCDDVPTLATAVEPPPSEDAPAVLAARQELAHAQTLQTSGRFGPAREAVSMAEHLLHETTYGPVRTELMLMKGQLLEAEGKYDDAEAALTEAMSLAAQWKQHDAMATAAVELMEVVGVDQKRFDAGLQHWAVAEGLSRSHPLLEAAARSSRGFVLAAQAHYDEAEVEYRAAFELRVKELGPDDFLVAKIRSRLAFTLGAMGRSEEAEAEFRRALETLERDLGPEHPSVGSLRHNLANPLLAMGRLEEAQREYRAAVSILDRAYGPVHPQIANSHAGIANTLYKQGKYAEAESEYRIVVSMLEQSLGPDHPNLARLRGNFANILKTVGKLGEAEAQYRAALTVNEQAMGADHPDVALLRLNLANLLFERGDSRRAEIEYRVGLASMTESLGAEPPKVALLRSNFAVILLHGDQPDEAEVEARAALEIRTKALGPSHPDVSVSRHALADVLRAQSRHEEAETHYRDALTALEAELGPDHADVATRRNGFALTLRALGKHDEAEAEYRKALAALRTSLGTEHATVAKLRSNLANLLLNTDRAERALPLAQRAWIRLKADGVSDSSRAHAAFVLAQALWGAAETPRNRKRARTLAEDALGAYREAGEHYATEQAEVQQWLDEFIACTGPGRRPRECRRH